jgi:hypothetical protein
MIASSAIEGFTFEKLKFFKIFSKDEIWIGSSSQKKLFWPMGGLQILKTTESSAYSVPTDPDPT